MVIRSLQGLYHVAIQRHNVYVLGISTAVPFIEGVHNRIHKHVGDDRTVKCEDIFKPFVKAGQVVTTKQSVWRQTFTAPSFQEQNVTIDVYKTAAHPPPMYTTDCDRVAALHLVLAPTRRQQKPMIDVEMRLCDTSLTVTAKEQGTHRQVKSEINFLR